MTTLNHNRRFPVISGGSAGGTDGELRGVGAGNDRSDAGSKVGSKVGSASDVSIADGFMVEQEELGMFRLDEKGQGWRSKHLTN